MNKGRYWVLAAAIVVVVAVVAWLLNEPSDEPAIATQVEAPTQSITLPVADPAMASRGTGGEHRPGRGESALPVSASTEVRAASVPIDISPGFERFLAPDKEPSDLSPAVMTLRQHRKLQTEARDDAWANGVEHDIRSLVEKELTAMGFDTHRIELPVLDCRSTGCEIQAIGYPEDTRARKDLQFIMPKLFAGPRGAELDRDSFSMMVSSLPDGRAGFLVFLWRKQP
jgi:hypothetical protein